MSKQHFVFFLCGIVFMLIFCGFKHHHVYFYNRHIFFCLPVLAQANVEENNLVYINEQNFPDAVFRAWLTNVENIHGFGADGVFTQEELAQITSIQIPQNVNAMVTNLQGIACFFNLEKLIVPRHALTALDVTQNTKLTYVNCSYNRLSELHVENLPQLKTLFCEFNYLTELNLSGLTSLTVLYCRHNVLQALSFESATKLKFIETFDNMLTEIDVSMLADLEFLHIDHNRLTHLDMRYNAKLQGGGFVVRNNYIQELKLPNIPEFTVYYDDFAEQNPILGYERVAWYADALYTIPITTDVEALGQTLYVKRIPNDYTIQFSTTAGAGVPSNIFAQYNTEVQLPSQAPTRTGYVFRGWGDDPLQAQKVYQPGEVVQNLAGKIQGDSITLYALWQPITYTVVFDGNADDVVGNMPPIQVSYDSTYTLPNHAFTREKYDFIGWAYTSQGSVVFKENQAIYNLTSVAGKNITLYAVWELNAEETRKPYVAQLETAVSNYDKNMFVTEDWQTLQTYYQTAQEEIVLAQKNTASMKQIVKKAQLNMSLVFTKQDRVNEIINGWRADFAYALTCIHNPPLPQDVKKLQENIQQALQQASLQNLVIYSSLNNEQSKQDVVEYAYADIMLQCQAMQELLPVVDWVLEVEDICNLLLQNIFSTHADFLTKQCQFLQALPMEKQTYIPAQLKQALYVRQALAEQKHTAQQNLEVVMGKYKQDEYSVANWGKIQNMYVQAVQNIETVASQAEISHILAQAQQTIHSIPTLAQEAEAQALQRKQNIVKYVFIFGLMVTCLSLGVWVIVRKTKRKNIQ